MVTTDDGTQPDGVTHATPHANGVGIGDVESAAQRVGEIADALVDALQVVDDEMEKPVRLHVKVALSTVHMCWRQLEGLSSDLRYLVDEGRREPAVTIRRATRPPDRFTRIDNQVIEDERLSFKALGLLIYILSKPDHWEVRREQLAATHKDGEDSVRSGMTELYKHGYIARARFRKPDGTFGWIHEVVDTPFSGTKRATTDPATTGGKPPTGSDQDKQEETPGGTTGGLSTGGKPTVLVTTDVATTEVVTTDARASLAVVPNGSHDMAFRAFWNAYPRKAQEPKARQAWTKAIRRARDFDIVAAAVRYRDDPNREDQFTPYPAKWLDGDCWNDPPLPARTQATKQARNRQRLAHLAADNHAIDAQSWTQP